MADVLFQIDAHWSKADPMTLPEIVQSRVHHFDESPDAVGLWAELVTRLMEKNILEPQEVAAIVNITRGANIEVWEPADGTS